MAFELVIPFLRPIAHLITDPDVSEIMVNGARHLFVERGGPLNSLAGGHLDERNLQVAVKNIARALGDDISEEQPILDARPRTVARGRRVPVQPRRHDPDDSQVPAALFTADELVRAGMMSPAMLVQIATRSNAITRSSSAEEPEERPPS